MRYTIKHFIIHVYAGTSTLLSENPALIISAEIEDSSQPICRKDTGQKKKLRKWSRGHQFVVRGGGHIDSWAPLFKYDCHNHTEFILIIIGDVICT